MKTIELDVPIEEMETDDLRTTFSKVLEAHNDNIAEVADLETELGEYAEQVETLTEQVEGVKAYFAEKASATTSLEVDLLVDRFSLDELQDMAADADAKFSEELEPETETETEGGEETKFSEKPPKAPVEQEGQYSEAAMERLSKIPGLALRD